MTEKKTTTASRAATLPAPRKIGVKLRTDITLGWVAREYPQLEPWRALAVEWLKGETHGVDTRLQAIVSFFERYLVKLSLPFDPAVFLARRRASRFLSDGVP